MKKLLQALMALALMVSGARAQAEYPDISIGDLKKAIEEKKAVVIDVNGSDSWKEGHVPTAHDWAAIKGDLAKKLPEDKDALIVAYCGGPRCSAYKAAANAAKELGYKNVKHLAAGISGWKAAGEKTEAGKEEKKEEKKDTAAAGAPATHTYVATFTGVTCVACKAHVKEAIAKLPGGATTDIKAGEKEGTTLVTFTATCDGVCKSKLVEALGEGAKTYVVQDLVASK